MLKTMYGNKGIDWNTQLLAIVMLENLDFVNTTLKRKQ
jgi:hypothetical protein